MYVMFCLIHYFSLEKALSTYFLAICEDMSLQLFVIFCILLFVIFCIKAEVVFGHKIYEKLNLSQYFL